MSSHHIVRENQEPALLIADFKALSEEYFGQLLEWSPTIITNVDNLDYLLAQDIKVDIVYDDIDIVNQEEIKRIPKQNSFLKDSLAYLVKHNYKAVNILVNTLDEDIISFAENLNLVVFVNGVRYAVVKSRYEKWKVKGEIMFLELSKLKSFNGLKHLHSNVFEVEQDGFVTIEMSTEDFVFVGEEI